MHLVIPYASCAARMPIDPSALPPTLPHLTRLLSALRGVQRDDGDAQAFSLPHERVLARLWGWPLSDGLMPYAALAAHADGLSVFGASHTHTEGWGLLQPAHWRVGREQIALTDPLALALEEDEARQLFEAIAVLFQDAGWTLHWGQARRWYVRHPSLRILPCASPDRVIGSAIDPWLRGHPAAGAIRRLQAEAQMIWHDHPVNLARQARGLDEINSFWLSGTGPTPAAPPTPDVLVATQVDDRLRFPTMAGDAAARRAAWAALDAGPFRDLAERLDAGENVTLTLCGELHAATFKAQARAWWQRGPWSPRQPQWTTLLAQL